MNKIIESYIFLERKLLNLKFRKMYWGMNKGEAQSKDILFNRNILNKRKRELRDKKIIIENEMARWNLPNCKSMVSVPVAIQLDKINAPINLRKHKRKLS